MHTTRAHRTLRTVGAALLIALSQSSLAHAIDPIYQSWRGLAIKGSDPVAYFSEGRPVEGRAEFATEWQGARWRFASAANRDSFVSDPKRYAPQYGGYCAWAVSQGSTASSDPEAWKIVDGKLYLNYSTSIQEKWVRDIPGNIQKADANWPKLLTE